MQDNSTKETPLSTLKARNQPYHGLNKEAPQIMHIDLNAAFASAEQQAWSELRNEPVCVTNAMSVECCMIAVSYAAKRRGVKTGMRLSEAKAICPDLIVLETDPTKYTHMYKGLISIMKSYSPKIYMKSIDEGVIDFHDLGPTLRGRKLTDVGMEIKQRVYETLGDHMHINVGIGTNMFYAKMAAGWHKPNGLDVLSHRNIVDFYKTLELQDLTGIADGYGTRLWTHDIKSPMEFLEASPILLQKQVFRAIVGVHWYNRLRGYEVDDFVTQKSRFGREKVMKTPTKDEVTLRSYLHFLTEVTGIKMRYAGYEARGVCVRFQYITGEVWYEKKTYKVPFYETKKIWYYVLKIFNKRPLDNKVRHMEVYVYHVTPSLDIQLSLFDFVNKDKWLSQAIDDVNNRYGNYTVISADSLLGKKEIKQKIPFGGVEFFEKLIEDAE